MRNFFNLKRSIYTDENSPSRRKQFVQEMNFHALHGILQIFHAIYAYYLTEFLKSAYTKPTSKKGGVIMRQAAMAAAYVYYRGYYFTRGYLAYPSHEP